MPPTRIPIRFGVMKPVLVLFGLTPRRSYLEIEPDVVRVRMSWGFQADVPRDAIGSLRRVRFVSSIGVHGWRGRWIVNGAAGPLLGIAIDPPVRARAVGLRVRLRELFVSLDDPDAVAHALGRG